MRALIYIFSLVCAGTMLAQPNWDFDITDKSHNILVPSDLEGISLEQGDYVGVFYEQNGELLCAGHSEYTEGNFVLTAFGASFSYPGFQVGQTFHFMHWSGATETQSEFFVVFNSIDFPNGAHFVVDGMSGISSVAQNPILGCLDSQAVNYNPLASLDDGSCISLFESMYTQSIDSIQGLHIAYTDIIQNLTYVVDSNQAELFNLENTLDNLESSTNILLDSLSTLNLLYGDISFLEDSISVLHISYTSDNDSLLGLLDENDLELIANESTIEDLEDFSNSLVDSIAILNLLYDDIDYFQDSISELHVSYTAYSDSLQNLLNLLSDTGSTGNNFLYIDLLQGWNIIGYSLNFETSATEAFSSVVNQLEIVKNNAADVYWVEYDFNGIGNLIPGQGYQVRMHEAVDNFYFE